MTTYKWPISKLKSALRHLSLGNINQIAIRSHFTLVGLVHIKKNTGEGIMGRKPYPILVGLLTISTLLESSMDAFLKTKN